MEMTLHCEETIDYGHTLVGYDGKCKRPHGHTGKVEIWVKGDHTELNEVGILFDFHEIKKLKEIMDHYDLSAIFKEKGLGNPTTEHIALYIYNYLHEVPDYPNFLFKVRFYENCVMKNNYVEIGDFE